MSPLHTPTTTGYNGPLRRGNSVCSCVCRCKCLCMCVCVFVWHGWPEECSGSRLAEPSQWTGSFTLQGNSTLIQREREREREGRAKAKCLQLSEKLHSSIQSCSLCLFVCFQFASNRFVCVCQTLCKLVIPQFHPAPSAKIHTCKNHIKMSLLLFVVCTKAYLK